MPMMCLLVGLVRPVSMLESEAGEIAERVAESCREMVVCSVVVVVLRGADWPYEIGER